LSLTLHNTHTVTPSHWEMSTHNTWFLWPTGVLNPNGNSIRSAVFAGPTAVTDRQTDWDRATRSVTACCIYVHVSTCDAAQKLYRVINISIQYV